MYKILVVDDSLKNLEAAKKGLSEAGYRVFVTDSPEDVSGIIAENPDILFCITDKNMPIKRGEAVDKDGYRSVVVECARNLIPVFMLTAGSHFEPIPGELEMVRLMRLEVMDSIFIVCLREDKSISEKTYLKSLSEKEIFSRIRSRMFLYRDFDFPASKESISSWQWAAKTIEEDKDNQRENCIRRGVLEGQAYGEAVKNAIRLFPHA